MDRFAIGIKLLRQLGVEMIRYVAPTHKGAPPLIVAGLGCGIVMSVADQLAGYAGDYDLWVCDLPGAIGKESRVAALDTIAAMSASVWLLWCSIAPATVYIDGLKERGFLPAFPTWAYVKGDGSDESAQELRGIGVVPIEDIWSSGTPARIRNGITLGVGA